MYRILRIVLAVVLVTSFAGLVDAGPKDDWSVVRASGQVWVKSGGAQVASLGDLRKVSPGSSVATGAGGRILLQRGKETMILGPNTIMSLPSRPGRSFTTILESAGEIEFDVDKRNVKHFSVKTQRLAAVVKGTHFSVSVGSQSDTVSVDRGSVEVTDRSTGRRVNILPGQEARVSDNGLAVLGNGDHAEILPNGTGPDLPLEVGGGQASINVGGPNGVGVSVGGGNGVSASVGGENGVSVSAGGGSGVSVSAGGGGGVSVSAGGGGGVSAGVGGSGGVGVSVGGGGGISVNAGGLGIGLGGN